MRYGLGLATKRMLWMGLLALVGSAWGQEAEITVELPGGATMEMVWIPPGTFVMGAPGGFPSVPSIYRPQHEVTISRGFYIGKYELTQTQWKSVWGSGPWERFETVRACAQCPAVWFSWETAQDFIQRLNEATEDGQYRLPTEAEWEYAARAGTQTAWSFGDDVRMLDEYAWYSGNTCDGKGECFLHEVGLKKANPWGLYDMHGNVWEWVQDRYARRYTVEPQVDPLNTQPISDDPIFSIGYVKRGGSFANTYDNSQSFSRTGEELQARDWIIGMRLVYTPASTTAIPSDSWGKVKETGKPQRR